jgi:peptidoglycan/xylan/chitin deacetylase (PgdA/CDA1 family)
VVSDRLVLAYHAVSPSWPAALSVRPEQLDRQLGLLAEQGYRSARFTELVRGDCPERAVALTFDDGFRSVLEHGLPVLSRHGFVGTLFVVTAYPGGGGQLDWPRVNRWIGGPHEHELAPISWKDLRALAAAGWEIGSHTVSHPHLTGLDDRGLADELAGSRSACEQRLGIRCTSIAYPYGEVDRRVAVAARRAGYLAGAGLPGRIHRRHRLRWPRVGVWQRDAEWVFTAKLGRVSRRRLDLETGKMRALPRWRLLSP